MKHYTIDEISIAINSCVDKKDCDFLIDYINENRNQYYSFLVRVWLISLTVMSSVFSAIELNKNKDEEN